MFDLTTRTRVLRVVLAILILKVTGSIVSNYTTYAPPRFDSGFLQGRESYFFGGYSVAFYAHIVAGPLTLVAGMLLLSDRLRDRFPQLHRRLGRVQVAWVLIISLSGLWMSARTETGWIAGTGFAVLAVLTGACVVRGAWLATRRRFSAHRRWMWRTYILLCSAVALRLAAGLATLAQVDGDWTYQLAAWLCWLLPLAIFELIAASGVWQPDRVASGGVLKAVRR